MGGFNHQHVYVIQHRITDFNSKDEYWATCNCGDKYQVYLETDIKHLEDKIGIQKGMITRLNEEVYRLTAIIQELEGLE